jgi:hypothetical protein
MLLLWPGRGEQMSLPSNEPQLGMVVMLSIVAMIVLSCVGVVALSFVSTSTNSVDGLIHLFSETWKRGFDQLLGLLAGMGLSRRK